MLQLYKDQNKTQSSILDAVVVMVVIDTMDVEAEDAVIVDDVEEESKEDATRDDEEGKTPATMATAARRKFGGFNTRTPIFTKMKYRVQQCSLFSLHKSYGTNGVISCNISQA